MLNNFPVYVFSGITALSVLSTLPNFNSSVSISAVPKISSYSFAGASQYSFNYLLQKQKDKLKDKVKSFSTLPDNWNGYGAAALSQDVINRALQLLDNFFCKMEVFPTGRNSIQFELLNSKEEYFEIEVFSDKINIYEELRDSEKEQEDISGTELERLVSEFYERIGD